MTLGPGTSSTATSGCLRVATIEEGPKREVWVRHRPCVIEAVYLRQIDWSAFFGNNSPRFIEKSGTWLER